MFYWATVKAGTTLAKSDVETKVERVDSVAGATAGTSAK